MMFPPIQLNHIVVLTNRELSKITTLITTKGEILKFFGVIILATRFEFQSRASLWSATALSRYTPAAALGKTGMSRTRFDLLWKSIRFSDQPEERPVGVTSEQHRWMLVDDFVSNFNSHRESQVVPSWVLCVDESISRWYGQGGNWINLGLPMYISIDRKPENGCEIQDVACGESGIMMRLRLVKTPAASELLEHNGIPHGGNVLMSLVNPWALSDRVICADSFFASVSAAEALKRIGLRFIGVVKTATRKYPLAYLSSRDMVNRGDRVGVEARNDDGARLLAFVWMDRDRRYFVSTASSISNGSDFVRHRWRQVDPTPDADPERVELRVPQPKASEIYYGACGLIDQHNRHRQSTLAIETKLPTKKWDMRVNLSILSMIIVDSWMVFEQATRTNESQKDYYSLLAEELIDNTYDFRRASRRSGRDGENLSPAVTEAAAQGRSGVDIHLTPTKRMRKDKNGTLTRYRRQGRCRVCKMKTTSVCLVCEEDPNLQNESWICHSKEGRGCFSTHLTDHHT